MKHLVGTKLTNQEVSLLEGTRCKDCPRLIGPQPTEARRAKEVCCSDQGGKILTQRVVPLSRECAILKSLTKAA